jgi:hypothetical protein
MPWLFGKEKCNWGNLAMDSAVKDLKYAGLTISKGINVTLIQMGTI